MGGCSAENSHKTLKVSKSDVLEKEIMVSRISKFGAPSPHMLSFQGCTVCYVKSSKPSFSIILSEEVSMDGHAYSQCVSNLFWVVVSNIFYFHPYLGKIPILTNIFQMG